MLKYNLPIPWNGPPAMASSKIVNSPFSRDHSQEENGFSVPTVSIIITCYTERERERCHSTCRISISSTNLSKRTDYGQWQQSPLTQFSI